MEPCHRAQKTKEASSKFRCPSRRWGTACKSGTEFYSLDKNLSKGQSKSLESSSPEEIELEDESSLHRSSSWTCTGTDSSQFTWLHRDYLLQLNLGSAAVQIALSRIDDYFSDAEANDLRQAWMEAALGYLQWWKGGSELTVESVYYWDRFAGSTEQSLWTGISWVFPRFHKSRVPRSSY
jgi:hypothetical protein